jgi:mannose-1-phosphate guanylyltransferase
LGAPPDRPETGYGYIRRGAQLSPADDRALAFEVDKFVEKPDLPTASLYLDSGEYLWNTGLFVWTVSELVGQLERHTPEIADLLPLIGAGDSEAFFARVPTLSIDEGLLERSRDVAVLAIDFRWDDIGAWDALYRTHAIDSQGNVIIGDGFAIESSGTALYAVDGPVVAFGVDDLVIVRTAGVTFVTRRDQTPRLKSLIAALPDRLRFLE